MYAKTPNTITKRGSSKKESNESRQRRQSGPGKFKNEGKQSDPFVMPEIPEGSKTLRNQNKREFSTPKGKEESALTEREVHETVQQ